MQNNDYRKRFNDNVVKHHKFRSRIILAITITYLLLFYGYLFIKAAIMMLNR